MKNICIIPARGGSKRIPNKNIVDFHGKPLLAYATAAAKQSRLFGKNIYVSSDSPQILKLAKKFGVQAIKRPKRLASDSATLEDTAIHLLKTLNTKFDYLCQLMPNCPLRSAADVRKSFAIIKKSKTGSVISVTAYNFLYPFWAMEEKNGLLKFIFGKKYVVDSKKLTRNVYCPSGAVWWVKVKNFLKEKKFYGRKIAKYEMPLERAVDIDTYEDLRLAEKLWKI